VRPQPLGKVSIEEVISEDPALVRLIYQYLAWAAFWLVAASAVGLVLSLKLNDPDFLNSPFTVFGRLRPVHTNTLFWGWTSLAMVGLCLFVVPRTSRTPLYSLKLARISLWLWNTAVLAGWVALALGVNNGDQEYREYVWPIQLLFVAGMLIQLYNFFRTIERRQIQEIYISSWYIVAAMIWTSTLVAVVPSLVPTRAGADKHPGILHAPGGGDVVHPGGAGAHVLLPAKVSESPHLFLFTGRAGLLDATRLLYLDWRAPFYFQRDSLVDSDDRHCVQRGHDGSGLGRHREFPAYHARQMADDRPE